ncbi:short-chain dehydrogenase/reductase family protein [Purpureocillium lilacinum]|uniref:Uncharacterized protein n=2 Tax=Purpureocillium lilacinum TaxID=33203 RepID=A0ACC4DVB6_PURLI|nr:short-chain dehydrogenase/reductase family protein [Purpureocillium lilacinum]OAQ88705.1 short-chain dehydrogenase/reductase family protein [Purpureocillium lilacinum]
MARPPNYPRPPQHDSWFAPLSVDLFLKVLYVTLLHPFVCWIIPLCLRARTVKWEAPPMLFAFAWATLVSLGWAAAAVNRRVAYGAPREVDLGEEVIVVTGGASGLGMLVAEVYGMRGATVAVLDVNEMENGEARGVTYYKCDVSDKAQVARVAAEIEKDLGTPTVLINNAAIVVGKSFLNLTLDDIDTSLGTNLLGPFYCLKAFLPALIRSGRGGTIVNVSSVIGHLGAARLTDYAAAKAGLTALHRSLAAELRETHPEIRTVLVTPGQVSTPLFYGVQTPSAFLAPVVEPVDVARDIIAAVDAGTGGWAAMPLYARWVDWYNVLPAGVQVLARRLSGIDRGMRTFVGRRGAGGEDGKAS